MYIQVLLILLLILFLYVAYKLCWYAVKLMALKPCSRILIRGIFRSHFRVSCIEWRLVREDIPIL